MIQNNDINIINHWAQLIIANIISKYFSSSWPGQSEILIQIDDHDHDNLIFLIRLVMIIDFDQNDNNDNLIF